MQRRWQLNPLYRPMLLPTRPEKMTATSVVASRFLSLNQAAQVDALAQKPDTFAGLVVSNHDNHRAMDSDKLVSHESFHDAGLASGKFAMKQFRQQKRSSHREEQLMEETKSVFQLNSALSAWLLKSWKLPRVSRISTNFVSYRGIKALGPYMHL